MDNHELLNQIAEMMERQSSDIKLFIENNVTKRIDALFDGYKLTHEKQWELERETEKLKEQLVDLETRLAVLEKKVSA